MSPGGDEDIISPLKMRNEELEYFQLHCEQLTRTKQKIYCAYCTVMYYDDKISLLFTYFMK